MNATFFDSYFSGSRHAITFHIKVLQWMQSIDHPDLRHSNYWADYMREFLL